MPHLTAPSSRFHTSYLQAVKEFRAEGRGAEDDNSALGREIRRFADDWHEPVAFAAYTAWLRDQIRESVARANDYVPVTNLWYTDGEEYLGRLAIRHRLNDRLRAFGGHIGYDVRPTARRLGHATAMLRTALPMAHELGIESALINCLTGNTASRRVIEACGGVLEGEREGVLCFWVRTDG